MPDVTARIEEHLRGAGYAYRLIRHEPAASAEEYHEVLGTRYEQQAKALFLRVKRSGGKGFAVLALQAQKQADLGRVTRLLEAKDVRLATADQLAEVTGCSFGELPPFGTPFGVPLLVDRELLEESEIYFNVGSLTVSMILDPKVLLDSEKPILYP